MATSFEARWLTVGATRYGKFYERHSFIFRGVAGGRSVASNAGLGRCVCGSAYNSGQWYESSCSSGHCDVLNESYRDKRANNPVSIQKTGEPLTYQLDLVLFISSGR